MIKHRFILRGENDFKVFAAIPVEKKVLVWKQWTRPADWSALRAEATKGMALRHMLDRHLKEIEETYRTLSMESPIELAKFEEELHKEKDPATARAMLNEAVERVDQLLSDRRRRAEVTAQMRVLLCEKVEDIRAFVFYEATDNTRFQERVYELQRALLLPSGYQDALNEHLASLRRDSDHTISVVKEMHAKGKLSFSARRGGELMFKFYREILDTLDAANKVERMMIEHARSLEDLVSSEPKDLPACPEGVPFSVYTIELPSSTVNVVEGQAWIEGRDATDDERTVAEIVTQMLTERALNPHAETRIPVLSEDPKHEHKVREAEEREAKGKSEEPRMRTIKFSVAPPRYLRQAAERILASPRKAHWVIGHWREQAHGEGWKDRRRMWIKPHIRGLGEAGAVAARIAAPDEKVGSA